MLLIIILLLLCIFCVHYFLLLENWLAVLAVGTEAGKSSRNSGKERRKAKQTQRFSFLFVSLLVMDGMYGVPPEYADKALMTPENLIFPPDYHHDFLAAGRIPLFGSDEFFSSSAGIHRQQDEDDVATTTVMKAKIASHPQYSRLLQAYIDCQKVHNKLVEISCNL